MIITPGSTRYVFTQSAQPSGQGEVVGSLWYDTDDNFLRTYDGASWNLVGSSDIGDGHITILPWSYDSITAGTWTSGNTATQLLQSSFYSSAEDQNAELVYKVYLSPGSYRFFFLGSTGPSAGIITLYLDTTSKGTIDLYSAGQIENQLKQITGISVTSPALYSLKIKLATKNASSSAYGCIIGYMAMMRSA